MSSKSLKSIKEAIDALKLTEKLNIIKRSKRFCQECTRRFSFWVAVACFTLLEPILCSKWPVGVVFILQVITLAISTVLYFIQIVGVASREWDKIMLIEAMSSLSSLVIPKHMMDFTLMKLLIFFAAEGEYILEFGCILIGWGLIFWRPGLAALRCFRVFRLLWFYEVEIFKKGMETFFNPILGEVFVRRGFKVLKFSIKALSALGNEMFRLTRETRGGLLLMMVFFYAAYVLGAALWVETSNRNPKYHFGHKHHDDSTSSPTFEPTPYPSLYAGGGVDLGDEETDYCKTLGDCVYTLMRLTFFDGTGFDFAYSLTHKHRILFVIVIMYLCMTSFGILNGLVGIFGTAFAKASEMSFEENDEEESEEPETESTSEKMLKYSQRFSQKDLNTDDNNNNNDTTNVNNEKVNDNDKDDNNNDDDKYGYNDSSTTKLEDSSSKKQTVINTHGTVAQPPVTEEAPHFNEEQKARLAALLSKDVGSKFALKALSKPTSNAARRQTLKQIVTMKLNTGALPISTKNSNAVYAATPQSESNNELDTRYTNKYEEKPKLFQHQQQQQQTHHHHPVTTTAGMFGAFQKQKSAKLGGRNSNGGGNHGSLGDIGYGSGNNNAAMMHDMRNMTHQMNRMQSKMDKQSDMIYNMNHQITQLNQALLTLHPDLQEHIQPFPEPRRSSNHNIFSPESIASPPNEISSPRIVPGSSSNSNVSHNINNNNGSFVIPVTNNVAGPTTSVLANKLKGLANRVKANNSDNNVNDNNNVIEMSSMNNNNNNDEQRSIHLETLREVDDDEIEGK